MSRSRVLKKTLRFLYVSLLKSTGLLWLAKRKAAKRGIVVLTFHRVLDDAEFFSTSSLPGILVRKKTFEQFLFWVSRNFEMVDLQKGAPEWGSATRRPRLAITFDDGWLDNYQFVMPLAAQTGCPLTVFVCAGLAAIRFPFWPERVDYLISRMHDVSRLHRMFTGLPRNGSRRDLAQAVIARLKQMPPEDQEKQIRIVQESSPVLLPAGDQEPTNQTMSWDQVREMEKHGAAIGSHTVSHCILTTVSKGCARHELERSRSKIEANLGKPCNMLAYPNGNCNDEVAQAAQEAGYELAFANERGFWTRSTDRLRIPRTNIWEGKLTGPAGRFSRLMTEYHLFWSLPKGSGNSKELE